MKTAIILNDLQIPFQDQPLVDAVIWFAEQLNVDTVILNGDIVDFYSISEFSKDPLTKESLGDEIYQAQELMDRMNFAETCIWIGGNHEDRLRRYIWQHARAFAVLPELQFENLLRLDEYGFQWTPYGTGVDLGKLFVTHGDLVRKDSGVTAKSHFDKYGQPVLTGHTHRLGVFYKTRRGKVSVAYENGCLCKLTPEYAINPDWQQGFSVVHYEPQGGDFNVQQIPIFESNGQRVFYYGSERILI